MAKTKAVLLGVFVAILAHSAIGYCSVIHDICMTASGYSCESIVDAIYWSEGGDKTQYPYGIRSVACSGNKECRKVCLNTVRNNVKRWEKSRSHGDVRDYLTFLWNRYCPPSEHSKNAYWLKNVKYFLLHPKGVAQ